MGRSSSIALAGVVGIALVAMADRGSAQPVSGATPPSWHASHHAWYAFRSRPDGRSRAIVQRADRQRHALHYRCR